MFAFRLFILKQTGSVWKKKIQHLHTHGEDRAYRRGDKEIGECLRRAAVTVREKKTRRHEGEKKNRERERQIKTERRIKTERGIKVQNKQQTLKNIALIFICCLILL